MKNRDLMDSIFWKEIQIEIEMSFSYCELRGANKFDKSTRRLRRYLKMRHPYVIHLLYHSSYRLPRSATSNDLFASVRPGDLQSASSFGSRAVFWYKPDSLK